MKSLNLIKLLLLISITGCLLLQMNACNNKTQNKQMNPVKTDSTKLDTTKKATKISPNYGEDQHKIDSIKKSGKKGG